MSLRLPNTVTLPTRSLSPAGDIYARIDGASRQRVAGWRKRAGFPSSIQNKMDVKAVARWLASNRVHVIWE